MKMEGYNARVARASAGGGYTSTGCTAVLPCSEDGKPAAFDPTDRSYYIPIPADIDQKPSQFAKKRLRPKEEMVSMQYFWSWAVLYVRKEKCAKSAMAITNAFTAAHPHMVGHRKWIGTTANAEHRIPTDAIYFAAFPHGELAAFPHGELADDADAAFGAAEGGSGGPAGGGGGDAAATDGEGSDSEHAGGAADVAAGGAEAGAAAAGGSA